MTSAFSWQSSISLCPASFRTPRPNLPVTPGVSWLPTFAFQSPIMKRISFLGVSSKRSYRFPQNHLTSASSALLVGHRLELPWYWMVCLGNRDNSVIFEIASNYCISDSFVGHDGYSISSKGFLPTAVDIMVIWVKFTSQPCFCVVRRSRRTSLCICKVYLSCHYLVFSLKE